MKESTKRVIIILGALLAIVVCCLLLNLRQTVNFSKKYEGVDLTTDAEGVGREGTYMKYQTAHKEAARPQNDVDVDIFSYLNGEEVETYTNYAGVDQALYTGASSSVTWEVNIPQAGLYNILLEYIPVESRGVAIERSFYINDALPFDDAANIAFYRTWMDGGEKRVDNQGNEFRPVQVENYDWDSTYCRDDMGYVVEPFQFYFEKGLNTITMVGVNEPMVLKKVSITAVKEKVTYQEYIQNQPTVTQTADGLNYLRTVQGEESSLRSESSLYAKYDRSSPTTYPNSVTKTLLNYVGGDSWKTSGQWIEWNIEVPEDGYYNIMIKGRQNYTRGSVSSRTVHIDGEILFDELKEISFAYANDWECKTLSDENEDPFKFYLTKGTHTLRLEATLGDMGQILEELEDSTFRLNQMYRELLVYIGSTPDKYRDYHIDQMYPQMIDAMSLESKRLFKLVDDVVSVTGQKADKIASAQTLAQQLERFTKKPEKITIEFTTFKDNITALGTAILNMSETKMDVDYLVVSGTDAKVEKDKANGFAKAWHEIKSFFASFVVDYNSVGDVYDDKNGDGTIKVWVLTGRDQGTILKSMVDDTFIPNSGIGVNVEIVTGDALLTAVLAGRGPDVVLSVGADQPINYALRGAAEDLTQFTDLDQVLKSYNASSYAQYELEGGLYALPETQTFNVMFYRKDVLNELELEVPNTWQDVIEILPTIQGNNMSIGIPTAAGSNSIATPSTAVASTQPDLSMYFSLLFQNGGDLYNEAGTATTVDKEAGIEAFSDYTKYFTDYGIPMIYDFVSRFRSGEMPIGIVSYATYNTLMVSAPEIKGLWDFTLIPGTEQVDESGKTYIDRSDFVTGSATMMIKQNNDKKKQNAWEFMKWWASADSQVRFGREIEALLGSSARYATANYDAFTRLAWSARDIEILSEQWQWTKGIREVPGGYYTGRHITNAIRKVLNEQTDPRETILDYRIKIDDEIIKKREEFGLPIDR
ncbi:MAG TPA: extracellular solute-binding protein [Lachnospiraceae bacterium]|nr:extracellular solute-binding protein [Lachnospiraceae bacterium]